MNTCDTCDAPATAGALCQTCGEIVTEAERESDRLGDEWEAMA